MGSNRIGDSTTINRHHQLYQIKRIITENDASSYRDESIISWIYSIRLDDKWKWNNKISQSE